MKTPHHTLKQNACSCTHSMHDDKRRQFLVSMLASGAALSLPGLAHGSQISRIDGNVWVNGARVNYSTSIRAGDTVHTGSNSSIAFVEGKDAYLVREKSFLTLQGNNGVVDLLRLTTGALLAVFGRGNKTLRTSHATAGIRGTGIYMRSDEDKTYFCTCYGQVSLESVGGTQSELVTSSLQHNARFIRANGSYETDFEKAGLEDHGVKELEMLEALVGRTIPDGYTPDEMMPDMKK